MTWTCVTALGFVLCCVCVQLPVQAQTGASSVSSLSTASLSSPSESSSSASFGASSPSLSSAPLAAINGSVGNTVPGVDPFWGLHNTATVAELNTSLLTQFYPQYYTVALSWAQLNPKPHVYNWTQLDDFWEQALRPLNSPIPVVVVDCGAGSSPLSAGPSWMCPSGGVGSRQRPPYDLITNLTLAQIPATGFSASYYAMVTQLMLRLMSYGYTRAVFRCVSEPVSHYDLGHNQQLGVLQYTYWLATLKKATQDVNAQYGTRFLGGHGGIVGAQWMMCHYCQLGMQQPALQPDLLKVFVSIAERYDWGSAKKDPLFTDWCHASNVCAWSSSFSPRIWYAVMPNLTNVITHHDIHFHFKPRYFAPLVGQFTAIAQAQGWQPVPYTTEEESAVTLWSFASDGLIKQQPFMAADALRKWATGLRYNQTAMDFAVIGCTGTTYFGLFPSSPKGPVLQGCHPTSQQMYATGPLYAFLRQLVPGRSLITHDLSYPLTTAFMGPSIVYYVLQPFNGVTLAIVYYDAMLDADESTFAVLVQWPAGTSRVRQVTVLLNSTWIDNVGMANQPLNVTVGQSPLMFLFYA